MTARASSSGANGNSHEELVEISTTWWVSKNEFLVRSFLLAFFKALLASFKALLKAFYLRGGLALSGHKNRQHGYTMVA